MRYLLAVMLLCCLPAAALAQAPKITKGAKVYIEPSHGFETYLAAAFAEKGVPVLIVSDKSKADYEISSTVMPRDRTPQSSIVVNTAIAGSAGSLPAPTSLSISVDDVHSSVIVYAYTYDRHGYEISLQSGAESCAKHMKKFIEGQNR